MGRIGRVLNGLTVVLIGGSAFGAGNANQVATALSQQDAWLSSSPEGTGWNRYLMTDILRQELAAGDKVDCGNLAKVLGRYRSQVSGLNSRHFANTRHQLSNYANVLGIPKAVRWAEQLRSEALATPPIDEPTVQRARHELQDSSNALEQMLNAADPATQQGWKSFLKWNDLDGQLASGSPNWKTLEGIGTQFFNGHPGLEYPEFVRVRNSLRKYLYLGRLRQNESGQRIMQSNLIALADALEKYNRKPTTKAASDVATLLEWLDQLGRVPHLAKEIRAAYAKPNLNIRVSENLLLRRFSQAVDEQTAVNEMILGTQVRGMAVTTGQITADIVHSPNVARIDIVFHGATRTRSVGRQKPVTVRSTSSTDLEARKAFYVYSDRFTSAPARANARTSTTIHSITPDRNLGRRLIRRIAWSRANSQKSQAEAIASGRAARRLESQINQQSQELLTRAQQTLREQLLRPINRRGLIPESINSYSTDSHAVVLATQASKAQFAATTAPPMFYPDDDVVAQVHESAVNNTAEKAIAGLTLTDERIAELTEEITGSVPKELQIGEDKQPWSISFDWQQPVTVEFDNQMMKLAVRGRRFTSGERELNKVMEMSATYSMQTSPTGVVMIRQGDIEVTFPNNREGQNLSSRERIFRTLMQKKFSEVFKREIKGEGFTLPGRFETLGRIRLNDLSTENGWLSLGWK